MTTTTFKVLKHECASCTLVIEGLCEDTPGVQKAEMDIRRKLLHVEHDDSVTPKRLSETLRDEGYPVEIV